MVYITGGKIISQGLFGQSPVGEPPAGELKDLGPALLRQMVFQVFRRKVLKEVVIPVPESFIVKRDDEQVFTFETLNQPGAMNPSKVNSRAVELVAQDDLIQSIGFHLAYLMSTPERV